MTVCAVRCPCQQNTARAAMEACNVYGGLRLAGLAEDTSGRTIIALCAKFHGFHGNVPMSCTYERCPYLHTLPTELDKKEYLYVLGLIQDTVGDGLVCHEYGTWEPSIPNRAEVMQWHNKITFSLADAVQKNRAYKSYFSRETFDLMGAQNLLDNVQFSSVRF